MTQVSKAAKLFQLESLRACLRQFAAIFGSSHASFSAIFALFSLWLASRFTRKITSYLKEKLIDKDRCYVCGTWIDPSNVKSVRLTTKGTSRCLLDCVLQDSTEERKHAEVRQVPPNLACDIKELVRRCPQVLRKRQPVLRLSCEDERLFDPSAICKPSPAPPLAAFLFDGMVELRISSSKLQVIPPAIGKMQTLRKLILISNELEELPEEVGSLQSLDQLFLNGNYLQTLPKSIGTLPGLRELSADGNRLREIPDLMSPHFGLLTAAGNSLESFPRIMGAMHQLQVHGNLISDFPWDDIDFSKIEIFKAMGNRIKELSPSAVASMQWVRNFGISDNLLVKIPDEISSLKSLEWLFLYNNRLTSLPPGLIRGSRLQRLLVEGNPLQVDTLSMILGEAEQSHKDKPARKLVIALDDNQADRLCLNYANENEERTTEWPDCISVGHLIPVQDGGGGANRAGGMYVKLTRASQLRRPPGVGVSGMPDGPNSPLTSPANVLVVAFAASQGEPEWNGVLRSIAGNSHASMALMKLPEPEGALSAEPHFSDGSRFASLWARGSEGIQCAEGKGGDVEDFDVLTVCDARMRWYAEDISAVQATLEGVCKRYKKKVFLGASMGGFAALLHGSKFGDEVIAFGPQSLLAQAILRPPSADRSSLLELAGSVQEAVRAGQARGCRINVHCAADTHLEHALALPLEDLALTVYPFVPHAPFARAMERGGVLWTVVTAAVARLQAVDKDIASPHPSADTVRACVAVWGPGGTLHRKWATRLELLDFFFGEDAPVIPGPGDWYCVRCHGRNQKEHFFCFACWESVHKSGARSYESGNVPSVMDPGVCKVPDTGEYPRPGDWGCGSCGHAMFRCSRYCMNCSAFQEHPWTAIVEG